MIDLWETEAQKSGFQSRPIPRASLPESGKRVQKKVFATQVRAAKTLGTRMGHLLFLTWERDDARAGNPADFILTPFRTGADGRRMTAPDPLPTRRGKRFALAAIALYQGIIQFRLDIQRSWKGSDYVMREFLRGRYRAIEGALQTTIQGLLLQSWLRLPWSLRHMLFAAFRGEDESISSDWSRTCRGSLSAAFVTRGFQDILTTSQSRSAPRERYWHLYWATDREDRVGKIDLIAVGRIRGLGRITLCIQIKTGNDPYLEILLQDPSDIPTGDGRLDRLREDLWDGVEEFRRAHPDMKELRTNAYAAIIQTGASVAKITNIDRNSAHVRNLIEGMLTKFETDLKDRRRRERMYQEIDEPGLPRARAR